MTDPRAHAHRSEANRHDPLLAAVALETIPLFRGLSPPEQRHLHDLLGVKTVPAGVDILTAEEPADVAYLVLDGTVKVQVDHPDGTAVILAILRSGEVVAELAPGLRPHHRSPRCKAFNCAGGQAAVRWHHKGDPLAPTSSSTRARQTALVLVSRVNRTALLYEKLYVALGEPNRVGARRFSGVTGGATVT